MTTVIQSKKSTITQNGMRPINLRTDLVSLANLLELVFEDRMDSGGRAALNEMRYMSRIGPGLRLLTRLNDIALGISQGYVWMENDRLVGNVSIHATQWPSELGQAWIVANVGVHPDYRRRGIAKKLMWASMDLIRQRGGTTAILQVEADNTSAHELYHSLGFVDERYWTVWRRSNFSRMPRDTRDNKVYIRRRRRHEWQDEWALAERIRPQKQGGLGWLRPLHKGQFRKSWWATLGDWLNLRGTERLVIRSDHDDRLLASLWIERAFAGRTRLTLLVDPLFQGIYDAPLLQTAIRRYDHTPLFIEHPSDETATNRLLKEHSFAPQHDFIHMRWDAR